TLDGAGAPPAAVDAGAPPPMPTSLPSGSPVSPDQLLADIEIGGMPVASRALTCGQCVDLSVLVRGGRPPYSYAWSAPALRGSGPHHVCPHGPVDYTVHVSDTPPQGEFRRASSQADARLHLDVGPCMSAPDSGRGPGVGTPRDAGVGVTPVDAGPS